MATKKLLFAAACAAPLCVASANAATIGYDFDDNDGVVDTNTFGAGVTVSDWTTVSGGGFDFNGSSHSGPTDGMARGGARNDANGPFTMSFTVTIDAATTVDLTSLAWENGADWNGVSWTPLWDLAITAGAATPSSGGFDSVQEITGGGFAFENEAVSLTGLTGLTNTSVTFTWDLTQQDRANSVAIIANTMDDVVLTGSVVPEPGSLALLALGGLMIARRRRG